VETYVNDVILLTFFTIETYVILVTS